MPKIKSAIKKMHQAEKKGAANRQAKNVIKTLLDDFKKKPSKKGFSALSSKLDKGVKTNLLHKNKSARLKSRLSKLLK
jgi:small subunit ribosomal protein S20